MIRVFLADDHPVVLQGVKRVLDLAADLEVVGVAERAYALAARVQETGADVLVLDLDMPGMGGARTLRRLAAAGVSVVVFSHYPEGVVRTDLLAAGARAVVSKERDLAYLAAVLREVAAGRAPAPESPPELPPLSARERQVFDGIARGMPLKALAAELNLSISTVHTYALRVREKLNVATNADIGRYADRMGLSLIGSRGEPS